MNHIYMIHSLKSKYTRSQAGTKPHLVANVILAKVESIVTTFAMYII